jgi:prepilin-type N-terminal cleavage/methylation domain-containing protein
MIANSTHLVKHGAKNSTSRGFSLVEAVVALAVLGAVLTFTLPTIFGQIDNFGWRQYQSKTALLRSKIQVGFTSSLSDRNVEDLDMDLIMNRAGFTYVENKNTGKMNHAMVWEDGSLHKPATVETHNLGAGVNDKHLYLLPFGGKLLTLGFTFKDVQLACGTNDNIALRMIYDNNGYASDHTRINEEDSENDSIYLYLYQDGSLRTLETVKPGTCTRDVSNLTPYDVDGAIT